MVLMILFLGTLVAVAKARNNGPPSGYNSGTHLATLPRATPDLDDHDVVAAVPAGADGAPFVAALPVTNENPQYSYSYGLRKVVNGATKSHHEARNGEIVQGNYNLLDSDGMVRTVNYAMDSSNGYKAIVHKNSPLMVMMPSRMTDRIPSSWAVSGFTFPIYPFDPIYVANFPFYRPF